MLALSPPRSPALRSALGLAAAIALLSIAPSSALAVTIDFESLAHGEVLDSELDGVSISGVNLNRDFDLIVGFNSDSIATGGTTDDDLEELVSGPTVWSGGNLANTRLGILLILQENDDDCETGVCSDPDDEGRRPAGDITFDFGDLPALDFGFDLVDVDDAMAERAYLTFFDGQDTAVVQLEDFLDDTSDRYDDSIVIGNNTANRFAAITAASLDLEKFDKVVLRLGGSGAVDNVVANVVPEPTTALLMALGLGGLASIRRR